MKTNLENNRQWPEELDALIAAPKHHKLLLENESVRVLDTCIPRGETTEIHTHQWRSTLYVLQFSDFIRYDIDGNILLDSRNLDSKPLPGTALWTEPLIPHSLKNVGVTDLHVISVELKQ